MSFQAANLNFYYIAQTNTTALLRKNIKRNSQNYISCLEKNKGFKEEWDFSFTFHENILPEFLLRIHILHYIPPPSLICNLQSGHNNT